MVEALLYLPLTESQLPVSTLAKTSDTLLDRAGAALSVARNTRENYRVYSSEHDEVETKKALLTSELRHAISKDQLFMVYQPKIELKTGHVAGVEALVRWQHPQLGVIAPDQFIPLAEETGLITQLTNAVLHKVLQQCQAWNQAGIKTKIAMNLSMWDLQDKRLAEQVPSLLTSYGVSPEQLELEITETAIMTSSPRVIDTLQHMRKMGLWLSIDDFGTGQSSLAYLKNLPVNEIKIDKTFVRNMSEDPNDTIIVQSVIELAHKLGLKTVAEGVENRKTKDMLRHFKCDAAQGYYLSKPISPLELNAWLRNQEKGQSQQIKVPKDETTWIDRMFQLNPFYQYAISSGD
jgi:EAL domain-containing protein (putative c-di-GMP-specific phosphodiesterase class I)